MIVFYHKGDKVVRSVGIEGFDGKPVTVALLEAAAKMPDANLVWCDERLSDFLALDAIPGLMHHNSQMFSYNVANRNYLTPVIGFCEEASPFIPIKYDVKYPTWQMSAQVGLVHASVVNAFSKYLFAGDNLDYFLNSFAKRAMRSGLLCYSEPALIKSGAPKIESRQANIFEIFKFIRQHYRMRWTSLLLLDMVLFKHGFPIFPYLFSLFYSRRQTDEQVFLEIPMESTRNIIETGELDVIIPTIGRREHFHDVLKDLAAQTYLPKRVIVVEQNPDPNSVSELDFIASEKWPFEIDHVFTHRAGACAARNVALMRTRSEFVFMADDDIRFQPNLIEQAFHYFRKTGNEVLQTAGPQPDEVINETNIFQHPVLGSGWVFLKQQCLDGVWFNPGYEFGYGEDKDFGMQLRNKGYDVLLVPFVHVIHLKAPMGGFRVKPIHPWSHEKIQPKPSPTVMLHMTRNMTEEQLKGYKTVYFFKNLGKRSKNPFKGYAKFKEAWASSVYWAGELGKR